jgi:hypothetical protein
MPIVFVLIFVAHFLSTNTTSFDSRWSIHTAMSIVQEGNTDLDEYDGNVIQEHDYSLEVVDGHLYSIFPVGPSLIAVPIVYALDVSTDRMIEFDLEEYLTEVVPGGVEVFVASIVIALASWVIYAIARLELDRKYSLLIVLIFAFSTSAWSTGSRALWQHGPSMLMLSLALYILLMARRQDRPALVQFAALPLAFAYLVRPTNSISIAIISLYVLIEYRGYFIAYMAWAATVAIPFFAFNLSVYDDILSPYYRLSPYYQPDRISLDRFFEALAGNLIAPSRGLLVYTPVFLFSIYGIFLKFWEKRAIRLDYYLVAIIVFHWVSISLFPLWWGGHAFGPRYMSDIIPYLMYFLIAAVAIFTGRQLDPGKPFQAANRWAMAGIFCAFVAAGFFIHYRGANDFDVIEWNVDPANVDQAPGRVWELDDIQFLRGLD